MGNMMRGASDSSKVNTDNPDSAQKGSDDDIVVVIDDYPSLEISEPIYKMGEKLRVIAQEAYWWRVRSIDTGKENYIPNSHVVRVYHGWLFEGVGRQKAEELLLLPGNRVGSFLVRESTSEREKYQLHQNRRDQFTERSWKASMRGDGLLEPSRRTADCRGFAVTDVELRVNPEHTFIFTEARAAGGTLHICVMASGS